MQVSNPTNGTSGTFKLKEAAQGQGHDLDLATAATEQPPASGRLSVSSSRARLSQASASPPRSGGRPASDPGRDRAQALPHADDRADRAGGATEREGLLDEEELAAELGLEGDGAELEGFGPSFAEELEELAQEIETGTDGGGSSE